MVLEGVNQALHQNGGTLLEFIGDEAGQKCMLGKCRKTGRDGGDMKKFRFLEVSKELLGQKC